jgi:23S rRNA pseudouridine2605 synthase
MMNRKKPFRSPRNTSPSRGPRTPDTAADAHRKKGPGPDEPRLAEDAADDVLDNESGAAEANAAPQLVRLNKYLADHGVASRRRCDELIQAGQISVDGAHVTELGLKVDPEHQVIEVDGVVLKPKDARKRYYVLNKPSGVVCTNEPRETRPRAVDLITDPYKGRIYTVGRLDEESKGLILVTNDGEFANKIMHPRYGIEKTYTVRVQGRIDDESLTKIREGVHLSEGRTSGARVLVDRRTHDMSQLTVIIHEGMNREIRRVFARVGYKVTDLRRVRIGPLTDHGLKPGRWRELLNREVEELLSGKNQSDAGSRTHGGPPKRFPKKRGYARDFVKGGKLVPGAQRERESRSKYRVRPDKAFVDAHGRSRSEGPRDEGQRGSGSRSSGAPRFGGPRSGPRSAGPRSGGPRSQGSRSDGPRKSGPGSGAPHAPRASHARPGARRPPQGRSQRGGPR